MNTCTGLHVTPDPVSGHIAEKVPNNTICSLFYITVWDSSYLFLWQVWSNARHWHSIPFVHAYCFYILYTCTIFSKCMTFVKHILQVLQRTGGFMIRHLNDADLDDSLGTMLSRCMHYIRPRATSQVRSRAAAHPLWDAELRLSDQVWNGMLK